MVLFNFQGWPTTILVVSHDRSFLDGVATDIIHMHSNRLDCYRGNYEVRSAVCDVIKTSLTSQYGGSLAGSYF